MGSHDQRGSAAGPTHADDLDLVRRADRRDPRAVEELLRRLGCLPAMLREIHRSHGSPLTADELGEVQQNALGSLWSRIESYEGRAALETWAYRFAQLEMLKALERRKRNLRQVPDSELRLEQAAQREEPPDAPVDSGLLLEQLERIERPAADVIRARHFDDLSFDEIARRCAEPRNTIKARYYRGLERLRELLQAHLRRER